MELTKIREKLLRTRTKSEIRFAAMLTEHKIDFREQEIIEGYIPDFYFPQYQKRIIELDGKFHDKKKDEIRDEKLRRAGYRVLRVPSSDVFWNARWLMHRVQIFLQIPHEPVDRKHRKRRPKLKKKRGSPKWAKVPKLTKDHLPKHRTITGATKQIEMTPPKKRAIKVIKTAD